MGQFGSLGFRETKVCKFGISLGGSLEVWDSVMGEFWKFWDFVGRQLGSLGFRDAKVWKFGISFGRSFGSFVFRESKVWKFRISLGDSL